MSSTVSSRLSLIALLACLAAAVVVPSVALADGGQTIATASPVTYGQQEFGNTVNGGQGQPGCDSSTGHSYRSWWALSVTAGDMVTVDWGTQSTTMFMTIVPIGTTDFSLFDVTPVVSQNVNANYTNEATYTVPQDGVLPFEFKSDTGCGNQPAPYYFTASVLHGVVLSLPTLTKLSQAGTITVGVHNPDGAPINDASLTVTFEIEGANQDSYTAVGTAPASNGSATIAYTIPVALAGHGATIAATSSGAAYVAGPSPTESVEVQHPPSCIVPAVSRGTSLATAESDITSAHCSVGVVSRAHSKTVASGDVIKLGRKRDTKLANGAKISLVVSSGPARKRHRH